MQAWHAHSTIVESFWVMIIFSPARPCWGCKGYSWLEYLWRTWHKTIGTINNTSNSSGNGVEIDQSHRCGHRQAACREPAGSYDKTTRTAICFEHKTQYLLIRAPYTRIVVFWHISKIPPWLGSQISCNTPTFCIATIFVKYCYTTGSCLL